MGVTNYYNHNFFSSFFVFRVDWSQPWKVKFQYHSSLALYECILAVVALIDCQEVKEASIHLSVHWMQSN